jgi:hypothetical protein
VSYEGLSYENVSPAGVVRRLERWGLRLLEGLQFFAGLEADGSAGGDVDLFACAGVATYAGLARFDGEDTESAQFDAITLGECALHRAEDRVDRSLGLVPGKAGPLYDALDKILLDQAGTPFG